MSVTVEDLRARLETDLDDDTLERIRAAAVAEINEAHGDAATESETHLAHGAEWIVLNRPHASISTITERLRHSSDPVTLSSNDYREVGTYRLLRLQDGDNPSVCWGREVVVEYVPAIDAEVRDRVTLDLCALSVEFSAHESEKSGDWSGSQRDYQARRRAILQEIREGRAPFA